MIFELEEVNICVMLQEWQLCWVGVSGKNLAWGAEKEVSLSTIDLRKATSICTLNPLTCSVYCNIVMCIRIRVVRNFTN